MEIGTLGAQRDDVAALVAPGQRIDDAVLDLFPALRLVANYGVGYDQVDVAACRSRGVEVTNTPGVLDGATADLAFALLLATRRRLVEGDDHVRSGAWGTGWSEAPFLGREVSGSTLGIVGLGRIGSAMARRARGFDMRILYHQRRRLDGAELEYRELDDLLREVGRRLDPRAADAGDGRPHLTRATRAPAGWRDARQHVARRARRRGRTRRGARLGAHQRGPRRVRARACRARGALRPAERRVDAAHRQRHRRDARGDDARRRGQPLGGGARRAAAHTGSS